MVFTFQPPFWAGLSGYVAELGAAFLCADLELHLEPRDDHAAYVESWLRVLRDDKRFVFSAAAHAQRAVTFLHELQSG
ncbi:MAG: antirestriction protein ArdC [Brevundimonas sp.]|jgi:antirestriction protein ArdC|uniref:zincin-like metallopeptidase domain-containing protein n=1 Tax=Brevundimonas sp. TaxID=1871086 RepID=UPI0039E3FDC9